MVSFEKEEELHKVKKTFKKRKESIERGVRGKNKGKKSKKFLTKPKSKGPTPISARKTLRSFANNSGPLVRQVEEREVVQDNRSLFFRRELEQEEKGANKWLS